MGGTVVDVMSRDLRTVTPTTSVMNAALTMRLADVGSVLVMDGDYLCGIVTDRDIVVRAIANGRDAMRTPVSAICSRALTVVSPTTSVGQAVWLMREKALRRLPVVDDDGRLLGIVSIGDLAIGKDRQSVLAEISAAPANV
jgi:CBS domain-containing protein